MWAGLFFGFLLVKTCIRLNYLLLAITTIASLTANSASTVFGFILPAGVQAVARIPTPLSNPPGVSFLGTVKAAEASHAGIARCLVYQIIELIWDDVCCNGILQRGNRLRAPVRISQKEQNQRPERKDQHVIPVVGRIEWHLQNRGRFVVLDEKGSVRHLEKRC